MVSLKTSICYMACWKDVVKGKSHQSSLIASEKVDNEKILRFQVLSLFIGCRANDFHGEALPLLVLECSKVHEGVMGQTTWKDFIVPCCMYHYITLCETTCLRNCVWETTCSYPASFSRLSQQWTLSARWPAHIPPRRQRWSSWSAT